MPLLGRARILAGVLAAALLPSAALAGAEVRSKLTQEYDLKAVFLFNFAQFVDWPANAFADANTPITIGVLGQDPFGKSLDEVVANESAHDRKLVVRRFQTPEQVDSCQILFISASEAGRLDHIFAALAHRSVLTVGESREFTAHSGIIAFEVAQHRLRLRINVAAATAANLTISSQLLRQAEIVGSAGARE
jgi:hypothetical protein